MEVIEPVGRRVVQCAGGFLRSKSAFYGRSMFLAAKAAECSFLRRADFSTCRNSFRMNALRARSPSGDAR
jgi:hypothetical protein